MSSRHRKPTRTRNLVLAATAVGVLGAGVAGIATAQTSGHRPQATGSSAPRLGNAAQATGSVAAARPQRPRPSATRTSASASVTPSPSATGSTAPTTVPVTTAPTTVAPTTVAPSPAASSAPAPASVIEAVLAHINDARADADLPSLVLSAGLSTASEAHNALMTGGCGLSHQCPGEAGLGDRFTAAGVSWTSAGENIGQGNASDNDASIIEAANGLTDLMLAEVAPNDGHRKNLLNASFGRVGLAVTRGDDGRVWFTQDFVN